MLFIFTAWVVDCLISIIVPLPAFLPLLSFFVLSYSLSHSCFSQFNNFLKSLSQAYTQLDCIKTTPFNSGTTWKRCTALLYFPIYIVLASSINTKFDITVVCVDGRNTSEENDNIHCFKALLHYFVPRLPYITKKLSIGFVWLCTWYGERDWHTIITEDVVA